MLGVGLIGAGLQGERRVIALMGSKKAKLVLIADKDLSRARKLAGRSGCKATDDWREVLKASNVDLVLVCTPNVYHARMSIAAMKSGRHVLCEKPLARSVQEGKQMVAAAREYSVALKCGFNLRYHPAVAKALEWKARDKLGRIMFVRCTHGICGRPDYERDWRMNRKASGGGQLMDQGMHVLDLCRLFCGKFDQVKGWVGTFFWNVTVEDNAFALMRTRERVVAEFHVSWTEWKNVFSLEVFGTEGAAVVRGLGGSYGDESLSFISRPLGSQPFTEVSYAFRGDDGSWKDELLELVSMIDRGDIMKADGSEGLEALRLADAIYKSSSTGRTIRV